MLVIATEATPTVGFLATVIAGACPVAPDTEAYRTLLTPRWPYLYNNDVELAALVKNACTLGWNAVETWPLQEMQANIKEAYAARSHGS